MKVKIDTKEKFHVVVPEEPILSANMTEELNQLLLPYIENKIKLKSQNFEIYLTF